MSNENVYLNTHTQTQLIPPVRPDASTYSVAALGVLAELLAPLLDVLYVSEEKERVIPLLVKIMAHVVPYLRNHT